MSTSDLDQTMPIQPEGGKSSGETRPIRLSPADESEQIPEGEQTMPVPIQDSDALGETVVMKPVSIDEKKSPSANDIKPEEGESQIPPKASPKSSKGKEKQIGLQKPKRWTWILLGFAAVIVLGLIGSLLGYQIAIQMRIRNQASQVALTAAAQYQLAMEDIASGQFNVARQRLEYVIQLDPNFPGAVDALTQVMIFMAETAVPTNAPTPTTIPLTPTPDTRTEQQLFDAAASQLRARDWNGAIATIETLRKTNLTYRAVEVDGMYYTALRHRGMEKIISGGLEAGMYDLALAERIGPLDRDAESYRNWARYYLVGASFWRIDWGRVVEVFGELYLSLPNLSDGTGWTVQERYRVACINYADQLASQEKWCDARYYYDQALALGSGGVVVPTATAVSLICEPPTPTPTMTVIVTMTPTPLIVTEDPYLAICCKPEDPLYNPADPNCLTYICPAP